MMWEVPRREDTENFSDLQISVPSDMADHTDSLPGVCSPATMLKIQRFVCLYNWLYCWAHFVIPYSFKSPDSDLINKVDIWLQSSLCLNLFGGHL